MWIDCCKLSLLQRESLWLAVNILTNSFKISDNSSIGNYTGAGPKSENGQFKIFHIINFRALKNSIYRVLVY